MILGTLKFLVGLYFFANVITRQGSPKEFFEKIDFRANKFLLSLKDETVRSILWAANKVLFKLQLALYVLLMIVTFLFKPSQDFLLNWAYAFSISLLVNMSIPWNLDHVNFIKKFYLRSFLMLIPAIPIFALVISRCSGIDFFHPFKEWPFIKLFNYFGGSEWLLAFALSGILFIIYIIIPYVLFWLLLLPVFYITMLIVKIFQVLLDYIHTQINPNLLLVIMGGATVLLAPL